MVANPIESSVSGGSSDGGWDGSWESTEDGWWVVQPVPIDLAFIVKHCHDSIRDIPVAGHEMQCHGKVCSSQAAAKRCRRLHGLVQSAMEGFGAGCYGGIWCRMLWRTNDERLHCAKDLWKGNRINPVYLFV